MKKLLTIIIGLVLVLVPLYDWLTDTSGFGFGVAAIIVLKGFLVWVILIMGVSLVVYGLSTLKE